MKKNSPLRTNMIVCCIIIVGFIITSVISYRSNIGVFEKDVEHISILASDGIHSKMEAMFSKPIAISLAMANDNLLKSLLAKEKENPADETYIRRMRDYLYAYRKQYDFDSVFLISTGTNRYYDFNGLDRALTPGNPENTWYYDFLNSGDDYFLNVDNDEVSTADNDITVFVDCAIKDREGAILGVAGVGFRINSLQRMLREYNSGFGVQARLVDDNGIVRVSSNETGYEHVSPFNGPAYSEIRDNLLDKNRERRAFWYNSGKSSGYVVTQYIPNLKWHLIVENNTTEFKRKFSAQLLHGFIIIILVIIPVLFVITKVIRKYNAQIMELTVSQELEYQKSLHNATESLYENIYEFDVTRNRAGGESTIQYFTSLGMKADTPYDEALKVMAYRHIQSDYIQGYLDTFQSGHVLNAYNNGVTNLSYDFIFTGNPKKYCWMRVNAQIFFWNSDKSVRMIMYRKNIDAEKKRELMLLEEARKDSMTGCYNKKTTESLISEQLKPGASTDRKHALLIFDIDRFKSVNDTLGHAFGDHIIAEFAGELKTQFRNNDILGRLGGDKFILLLKDYGGPDMLRSKLDRFRSRIRRKEFGKKQCFHISCGIGVALFPEHGHTYAELCEKADQALYYSKTHGKGVFTIFGEDASKADS